VVGVGSGSREEPDSELEPSLLRSDDNSPSGVVLEEALGFNGEDRLRATGGAIAGARGNGKNAMFIYFNARLRWIGGRLT
jgi:hypothetical protein